MHFCGGSIHFDGVVCRDSVVSLIASVILRYFISGSITVSAWVKPGETADLSLG